MKTLRFLIAPISSLCLLVGCLSGFPVWTAGEVPFIPTPPEVVDRMLELAEVKKGDVVYDVGSGDGRIVIAAAKKYGVRGVGIEIDPDLVQRSREKARTEGVDYLAEFREQDALKVDLTEATVVTLYMMPEFNAKLRPILEKHLRPGWRVVAHDFGVEGWTPARIERLKGDFLHSHTIYLYVWKTEDR